jgi:GR25 family glycosyltransferase involved in LPS biosynthesis
LRQVFTPWHDGNNTCTIEEYCLQNSRQCIDYRRDIRETNDIEEIISYYQEGDEPYLFCKLYNENEYYAYPEVIKKYIQAGFTKGIEDIEDLSIMVSNDQDESNVSLQNRIKKLENLLSANKERLEQVQQNRNDCNNKADLYREMIRLNSVIKKLSIDQEEIQYALNCSNELFIKKQSEQNMYKAYCIVYSKSKKRLENYYKCKNIIPELIYIDAVDSISKYDFYKNIALENGLLTDRYIDSTSYYKGKLGCNISHMYVLYDFIKKNNIEWILVIEDDVEIINYDKDIINRIIEKANEHDSHFIQLCTDERFLQVQMQKEKVDENLYLMVPQWGAAAYLISKKGAKMIQEIHPLDENIDGVYSNNIYRLRSLCYLNQIFINKGGEFGSIILENKII